MKTYIVTLTESQLKANSEFLRRVELKGLESYAHVDLIEALKRATLTEASKEVDG